ncbi:MAG: GAF domain-containing sensor histidine kinase [Prevotellaceae bacterium]|jgi:signal transduction histidine kinase|nr:GAF domain-containing sensor histidine kinase [Prevotellaceae bacterium]
MEKVNDSLINNLRAKLLNASVQKGLELLNSIVDAIQEATDCTMCSLWSINNNNTNGGFRSASLVVRKLEDRLSYYSFNADEDYVHDIDLRGCFIKHVLSKTEQFQLPYHYCDISECQEHRSKKAIEDLNLKFFISIPIYYQDALRVPIALLKLSYRDKPQIAQLDLFSTIIRDVISSCMYRYMLYKMKHIMEDLVKNYQAKGSKRNLGDIFHPILNTILRNYCAYEGASFFMWDSFMNHFKLLLTTGIVNKQLYIKGEKVLINKNDFQTIFYQAGEGFTGEAAKEKRSMICDDLDKEKNNPIHKEKFIESTQNKGKTMMIVPILRPSKSDEVIGILRFVNKTNQKNSKVVDYFNAADKEIIEYASKYLALIIDYFLGEEERNDFISKLSHEFRTPALLINLSADRLIKNNKRSSFLLRYLPPYLENIRDFSKLQLQQAESNLHISKIRVSTPRSQKYITEEHLLKDVICQGKTTVIAFARVEGVRFDDIGIDVNFPAWKLYIDEVGFTTVFYNLLTNAIKYRNPNIGFSVTITGEEINNWLIVNVSDYGLGIEPEDKDKIFLMGFRGDNVTKHNKDGFGIGLPVVKRIIEDFDGEIRVSNFFNPTTFEIKLPKKLFNDKYTKETVWNSVK